MQYELLSNEDLAANWPQTVFASNYGLLPEGDVAVYAAILVDVIPADLKRMDVADLLALAEDPDPSPKPVLQSGGAQVGGGRYRPARKTRAMLAEEWTAAARDLECDAGKGPQALTPGHTLTWENDDFFWMSKGLGQLWTQKLQPEPEPGPAAHLLGAWIARYGDRFLAPITDGSQTRVRIEVPDDLESRVRELVDSTDDPLAFGKWAYQRNTPTAKISECPFVRPVKMTVVGTAPLAELPLAAPTASQSN